MQKSHHNTNMIVMYSWVRRRFLYERNYLYSRKKYFCLPKRYNFSACLTLISAPSDHATSSRINCPRGSQGKHTPLKHDFCCGYHDVLLNLESRCWLHERQEASDPSHCFVTYLLLPWCNFLLVMPACSSCLVVLQCSHWEQKMVVLFCLSQFPGCTPS